jgi:hypothetical protein
MLRVLSALVLTLAAAVCPAAQPVPASQADAPDSVAIDLRPKFVLGREDRFMVEMTSTSEGKWVESQITRPDRYHQKLRVRRTIIEATPEGATLELVYEAAKVAITAGDRSIEFNSEAINDPEPELALGPAIKAAIHKPVRVQVDGHGRFLKMTGAPTEGGPPPANSLMHEDMFRKRLTPLYGLGIEETSHKVGDSWTESVTGAPEQTGTFTTDRTYHLESVHEGVATITVTGALTLAPSPKAAEAKTIIESQSIRGRIDFDHQGGFVRNWTYSQSMKLLAETGGRGRMAVKTYDLSIAWLPVWPPAPPAPPAPPTAPPRPAPPAEAPAPAAK